VGREEDTSMRRTPILFFGIIMILASAPLVAQEEEQKEPNWKSKIGLSYLATTGNSETSTLGLDFTFERRPTPWGFEITGSANRAEDDEVLTAERYFLSGRAKRKLSDRLDLFAGVSGEQDQFALLDLRTLVEAGVVYTALTGPKHLLSLDGGLTYTDEDRIESEPDASFAGAVGGLSYEFKINDTTTLTQRLLYYPNFEESADWRVNSDTGLQVAMSSLLAIKLSYELRYRNQPIGDAEDTDTTGKVSLVVNF
jgi:putative salt-induced outer membrane protein